MALLRVADAVPVRLEATEHVEVVSVCDNVTDVLLIDQGPARRFRGAANAEKLDAPLLVGGTAADPPLAQHGFSALVRVAGGSREWSVLFDTGATPNGCIDNLRRLGIDPDEIDIVVLSHGHYDHVTGLSGLAPALGPRHVPVVVHPNAFRRRRYKIPDRPQPRELPQLDRAALEAAGFVVEAHDAPILLADDRLLVTGAVARHSAFEPGLPGQEALIDDRWESDPVVADDQALVMDVSGRGLVVLTGCGHSGIINIARYSKAITGVGQVHALMGGFHLGGPAFESAIDPTVAGLADLDPDVIVPTHCTGWRAIAAIADVLPDAFIHNSVGTTFDLVGAESSAT